MRPRLAVFLAALLGIALVSCANLPALNTSPNVPRSYPLPVNADMRRWWHEVEGCTGMHGNIGRIKFALWMDTIFTLYGLPLDGAYVYDQRTVYVRAYDPAVIRHEMAHALLPRPSENNYHDPVIGVVCAALFRWP